MNEQPKQEEAVDDDSYEYSAFQWPYKKLTVLMSQANEDPQGQTQISRSDLNKIYLSYIGALEIAKEQTQAEVTIDGKNFLCSTALQKALTSIIADHYGRIAMEDVAKDLALLDGATPKLGLKH